jgi:hypothetical protein
MYGVYGGHVIGDGNIGGTDGGTTMGVCGGAVMVMLCAIGRASNSATFFSSTLIRFNSSCVLFIALVPLPYPSW